MADEKGGGIMAIIGAGKPDKGFGSEKKSGGASSAKARALQSMSEAMKAGNFDEAAEHFQAAYDECAMSEPEETEDELDLGEEE
jgi:hypothetical protein